MTDGEVKEIIELLNKCGSVEYSIKKLNTFVKRQQIILKHLKIVKLESCYLSFQS